MIHARRATGTALLVIVCATLGAQEADRARTEALSNRAADRLNALHEEADRLASEARTVIGDLRALEVEREIKIEEARRAREGAAAVSRDLAALDEQIAALQARNENGLPDLEARLVGLYKLGRGRYLRLLLSTADVGRVGDAARTVAMLAGQDHDRLVAYQQRLAAFTAARKTMASRQAELERLRAATARASGEADRAVAARNDLIRQIDERRDLNAQLAGELMAAQQRLQAALTGLAAASPGSSNLPIGPFRGDLEWPVAGALRQGFGSAGRPGRTPSNGLDLAATEGAPVHAVHDGSVTFADAFVGFGRLVILDHGAQAFSLYGNLDQLAVTRGARVARGEPLGTVGVSATGAAGLYFELRIDGRPVDPVEWLKKR
jgi:septal ring factor EnvC (AmiA/AmiB activator)